MQLRLAPFVLATALICSACAFTSDDKYVVQSEFQEQEYIWLSWVETGFLGGAPFCHTILDAMKAITPHVNVRLLYTPLTHDDSLSLRTRIVAKLVEQAVDTSRVELIMTARLYAAIQDPGPIFLKNGKGEFAVADFKFSHPDTTTESIDRNIARLCNFPTVRSSMITEGGAWQSNGKGSLLLVEAVELDRNKPMTRDQIEEEYKRVLGVTKIIWLKQGAKEEAWGQLENGVYAIGTGGHIDEFCRFVDAHTIVLAEVYPVDTIDNIIATETYRRMEENAAILARATDQDGVPFKILRAPMALPITKKIATAGLSREESYYLQQTTADSAAFYLTTGYFNFVIANGTVVTSKYWQAGMDRKLRERDEAAKAALQKAFPGRTIVQIDCMPVHHDGAGLHCHSRSQPK